MIPAAAKSAFKAAFYFLTAYSSLSVSILVFGGNAGWSRNSIEADCHSGTQRDPTCRGPLYSVDSASVVTTL